MSEPTAIASTVELLVPGIFHWTVEDDRIAFRSDAYALATTAGTVLIDPLPVAAKALERLGRIEAICLSVQSHQRSSWKLRRQLGVRVYAPRAAEGLEESPDHWYSEGDPLPGGLRAIHAPGPCEASYVFYSRETSVLFLGDLLIREPRGRFRFVSDEYMDDPPAARASVEKILALSDLSYDVLCSAHGNPLKGGTVDAIRRAIPRR